MDQEFVEFGQGLFDTKALKTGSGYTWTLASRVGHMLSELEDMFGERDRQWTILGVEINMESSVPQNWHPYGMKRKNIIFQLVPPADKDVVCANYQLAHEVVHSLSPNIGLRVNVLEEGLATWFALCYVKTYLGVDMQVERNSYRAAREAVAQLLKIDHEAVKKLRHVEPCLKLITRETFAEAGLLVEPELIQALLSPFER